jgi:hypothetical protein
MFFYVGGTKAKRVTLGYVAEWCGRCQRATAGALLELRRVRHAYFVPLGSGTVLGHEFHCGGCGVTTSTLASRFASVAHSPQTPLHELLANTNPTLDAALHRAQGPGPA